MQERALVRFLYWIKERHAIHRRRVAGKPKPWTKDPVLQTVFFTNPYRENDKTTVWFRENVREPLCTSDRVLMATVIFRWFNLIRTGEALLKHDLLEYWDKRKALSLLKKQTPPVFTGAYMTRAGVGPGSKIPAVCDAITTVWKERERLAEVCHDERTLRSLWKELRQFKYIGKFVAYEIVCDLRYTGLLDEATDINTWANPGPGALRGLLRLEGGKPEGRKAKVEDPIGKMVKLLPVVRKRLRGMPPFELREVEHSLCEWDKYERARLVQGRLKRIYDGTGT